MKRLSLLLHSSIRDNTKTQYKSGFNAYTRFAKAHNLPVIPASQIVLCLFVTYMSEQNVSWKTIQNYLYGVRHIHIALGLTDPINNSTMLQHALKGAMRVTRSEGAGRKYTKRTPITENVIKQMRPFMDETRYGGLLILAATCLGTFGLLRPSEFLITNTTKPNRVIMNRDIQYDQSTHSFNINLHEAKSDKFYEGQVVTISPTKNSLCPVQILLKFQHSKLTWMKEAHCPFLIHENGQCLSRDELITILQKIGQCAGIPDAHNIRGGSFRKGGAQSLQARNIPISTIKTIGRWTSNAIDSYLLPVEDKQLTIEAWNPQLHGNS